jgi:hypothetical protein
MTLPFGLQEADLATVEIVLRSYTDESGAPLNEIHLFGDGKVQLRINPNGCTLPPDQARPREGTLPPAAALSVLEMVASSGVKDLDPRQTDPEMEGASHSAWRTLEIIRPGEKTMITAEEGAVAGVFAEVWDAVKRAAAQALPEASRWVR